MYMEQQPDGTLRRSDGTIWSADGKTQLSGGVEQDRAPRGGPQGRGVQTLPDGREFIGEGQSQQQPADFYAPPVGFNQTPYDTASQEQAYDRYEQNSNSLRETYQQARASLDAAATMAQRSGNTPQIEALYRAAQNLDAQYEQQSQQLQEQMWAQQTAQQQGSLPGQYEQTGPLVSDLQNRMSSPEFAALPPQQQQAAQQLTEQMQQWQQGIAGMAPEDRQAAAGEIVMQDAAFRRQYEGLVGGYAEMAPDPNRPTDATPREAQRLPSGYSIEPNTGRLQRLDPATGSYVYADRLEPPQGMDPGSWWDPNRGWQPPMQPPGNPPVDDPNVQPPPRNDGRVWQWAGDATNGFWTSVFPPPPPPPPTLPDPYYDFGDSDQPPPRYIGPNGQPPPYQPPGVQPGPLSAFGNAPGVANANAPTGIGGPSDQSLVGGKPVSLTPQGRNLPGGGFSTTLPVNYTTSPYRDTAAYQSLMQNLTNRAVYSDSPGSYAQAFQQMLNQPQFSRLYDAPQQAWDQIQGQMGQGYSGLDPAVAAMTAQQVAAAQQGRQTFAQAQAQLFPGGTPPSTRDVFSGYRPETAANLYEGKYFGPQMVAGQQGLETGLQNRLQAGMRSQAMPQVGATSGLQQPNVMAGYNAADTSQQFAGLQGLPGFGQVGPLQQYGGNQAAQGLEQQLYGQLRQPPPVAERVGSQALSQGTIANPNFQDVFSGYKRPEFESLFEGLNKYEIPSKPGDRGYDARIANPDFYGLERDVARSLQTGMDPNALQNYLSSPQLEQIEFDRQRALQETKSRLAQRGVYDSTIASREIADVEERFSRAKRAAQMDSAAQAVQLRQAGTQMATQELGAQRGYGLDVAQARTQAAQQEADNYLKALQARQQALGTTAGQQIDLGRLTQDERNRYAQEQLQREQALQGVSGQQADLQRQYAQMGLGELGRQQQFGQAAGQFGLDVAREQYGAGAAQGQFGLQSAQARAQAQQQAEQNRLQGLQSQQQALSQGYGQNLQDQFSRAQANQGAQLQGLDLQRQYAGLAGTEVQGMRGYGTDTARLGLQATQSQQSAIEQQAQNRLQALVQQQQALSQQTGQQVNIAQLRQQAYSDVLKDSLSRDLAQQQVYGRQADLGAQQRQADLGRQFQYSQLGGQFGENLMGQFQQAAQGQYGSNTDQYQARQNALNALMAGLGTAVSTPYTDPRYGYGYGYPYGGYPYGGYPGYPQQPAPTPLPTGGK